MFVGGGVFENGADVDAALVGEGALSYVGLASWHLEVGQFRDVAGGGRDQLQLVGTDGLVAELQFEIRDDAGEVRVAATLAIAVETALYMRYALLYGCQGICDCYIRIVMDVDADDAVKLRAHIGYDLLRGTR